MSEDRVWKDWSQFAKQAVREQYPFHLHELESEVLKKIEKQNRNIRWQIISWTAGVAVAATFFLQVIQPFHGGNSLFGFSGARQYPAQFEWTTPDEGYTYALQRGYPILPELKLEKDGYTFQLKDVMVDQRRIIYTLLISGEQIEAIANEKDESKQFSMLYAGLTVELDVLSHSGGASKDLQLIDGTHYFVIKGSYMLNPQKMGELLNQPNPVLPVRIERQSKETKEVLAEMLMPLPKTVTIAEKVIKPSADLDGDSVLDALGLLTKLSVTQIEAAPTMMQVELEAKLKEGFELKRLEQAKLVDEKGNEYSAIDDKLNPNVKRVQGTNKYTMQFIPSLYYGEQPEKLELRFEGAVANQAKADSFVLNLKDKYPRDIPFGKQTLHILKAYYEKDKLFVVIPNKAPEEITLHVDEQSYKDLIVADSLETVTFGFPLPKKDSYTVKMSGLKWETLHFSGVVPIIR
ncbi:hypothetical protein [Brevibacillus sp. NRS-1366]|uniref:hypothetical protein n=1 Tax=Brevibacillus sp. NRS-1366 TaxID=3233899 RepID=UPI003D1F32DE